jgi:hypothetical protein
VRNDPGLPLVLGARCLVKQKSASEAKYNLSPLLPSLHKERGQEGERAKPLSKHLLPLLPGEGDKEGEVKNNRMKN